MPCLVKQRHTRWDSQGFTLIEIMIVITILAILASTALPRINVYFQKAKARAVASNLKSFGQAFRAYAAEYGNFPQDSHLSPPYHLPPNTDLHEFINVKVWIATTSLGGNYNWEGPDNYPYAGISLYNATAPVAVMKILDGMMDDGNLTQGVFRKTPNGRYTYILHE